jgi:hypothetical protein
MMTAEPDGDEISEQGDQRVKAIWRVGVMVGLLATGCRIEIFDPPAVTQVEEIEEIESVERPAPTPRPVSPTTVVVQPVTSPQTPTPVLTLAPKNAVRGQVFGPDGLPSGAGILVRGYEIPLSLGRMDERPVRIKAETRTDAEGRFELISEDGQPFGLEAIHSDTMKGFRTIAPAGTGDVVLDLAQTGAVSGRLVAPEGMSPEVVEGADAILRGTIYTAKADGEGRFMIDQVPAGEYELILVKSGLGPATTLRVVVSSGGTTPVLDMRLKAAS